MLLDRVLVVMDCRNVSYLPWFPGDRSLPDWRSHSTQPDTKVQRTCSFAKTQKKVTEGFSVQNSKRRSTCRMDTELLQCGRIVANLGKAATCMSDMEDLHCSDQFKTLFFGEFVKFSFYNTKHFFSRIRIIT